VAPRFAFCRLTPAVPISQRAIWAHGQIPKGLVADGEQAEDAALREFEEEASWRPVGQLLRLGEVKQRSGKRVVGFALRSGETEEELLAGAGGRSSLRVATRHCPPQE
jgi:predicted NUDIX family NTP pyrophosphohydrolase